MKKNSPVITVTKNNEIGTGSLHVSGKRVEGTPKVANKKDGADRNKNEFTFSAKGEREGHKQPAKLSAKSSKNQFERYSNVEEEQPVSKNEIFERLGIKNPEAEKVADLSGASFAASGLGKSKKEITSDLITNLESEIHKLKYKRDTILSQKQKKQQEELEKALREEADREDIQIYKDPERFQHLTHPISSLEKPTLDNVEALLRAHQEKMAELEKQYFERARQIEYQEPEVKQRKTVKTSPQRAGPPGASQTNPDELKNYSKVDPPPELNSYMTNPFLMKKKSRAAQRVRIENKRDDLKTYKEKFLDYLDEKRLKLERRRSVSPPEQKKNFDVYQPTSPNEKRARTKNKFDSSNLVENQNKSQSPARQARSDGFSNQFDLGKKGSRAASAKRLHQQDFSDFQDKIPESEFKLLQWVFNLMKKGDRPHISKEDVYHYMLNNQEIIELYDVDPVNLQDNLIHYPTNYKNSMNFNEFVAFLKGANPETFKDVSHTLNTTQSPAKEHYKPHRDPKDISEKKKLEKKFENVCLLSEEILETLREIFHNLDHQDDLIVPRMELLKRVRDDIRVKRILHKPAVHISEIDKYISMERLLKQIEDEERNAIGEQKKAKEYVSLNQFMKYFTNYETPPNLAEKLNEEPKKKNPKLAQEDDQDFTDMFPDHFKFFEGIFKTLPKKQNAFVETIYLIDEIRKSEHYKDISRDPGRRKAAKFDLPNENVEQVINRLENESESFLTWDEFIQFFTRRGRPRNLLKKEDRSEKALVDSGLATDPKDKFAQTGGRAIPTYERDGYDSDPETHIYSKDINYDYQLNRSIQGGQHQGSDDEDVDPTRSGVSKYMRYRRDNHTTGFDRKAIRDSLKEGDQEKERKSRKSDKEKLFGKQFGALYKDDGEYKFTTPEPFEFDMREKNRKKTIREAKLEEMVLEKQAEELKIRNHVFRAKSVPHNVKEPLFQKIMDVQENKRLEVKKNSVAITKMREAPFSFYERDRNRPPKGDYPLNEEFGVSFKANPVPPICQVPDLWKKMREKDENERKERVAKLAQENLLKASLPPRMAKWEEEKKGESLRQQVNEQNVSKKGPRKTFVANTVPDFHRLHSQFQDLLDRKRKSKVPTEPTPFAFQESRKGVIREYLDVENQYKKAAKDDMKRDPFEAVEKLKSIKPKVQPPTTKKMVAMMDKLKKEREDKQKTLESKQQEEVEREARYKRMKPRVQESPAIQDNTKAQQERAQKIKEEVKNQFLDSQKKFYEMKKNIEERVAGRPLLVEQETEKSKKTQVQAMKDLSKLKKIFQESGLRNPDQYFNQEENDLIEDAEYLQKKGIQDFQSK